MQQQLPLQQIVRKASTPASHRQTAWQSTQQQRWSGCRCLNSRQDWQTLMVMQLQSQAERDVLHDCNAGSLFFW
jgi:hypothetical protein